MPLAIESFGRAGYAERRLHLLEVDCVADLREVDLALDDHSAALLVWDAVAATDPEKLAVAEFLLDAGAVSICCWGEGCDAMGQVLSDRIQRPDDGVKRYSRAIMTTIHRKETFQEALWYLLWCSIPDDAFEASCNDTLVLAIGRPELAMRTRAALIDPDAFSEGVRRESAR